MIDKQIKEEIKQVVTNLGNIKFTVEDELEFCKQVLKRKEQECERLKEILKDEKDKYNKLAVNYDAYVSMVNEQLDKLKAESKEINEKLKEKFSEYTLKSSFTIAFQDDLLNKYKQTLIKIKKIANYSFNLSTSELMTKLEQILQKISECEAK